MEATDQHVDLVAAAARLKLSYHATHRLVLIGELQGVARDFERLCAEVPAKQNFLAQLMRLREKS